MTKTASDKTKWTSKETDLLVDEFIVRKVKYLQILANICFNWKLLIYFQDVINGNFSATVTKESKAVAWKELQTIIELECPDGDKKDVPHIKKKWTNLMREARIDIAKYNKSLSGTGNIRNC